MYIRRKVFSYSEPEEQLYSVTMTEDELDLFSDFMDLIEEDLYSDLSDVESGRDIGQLAGFGLGAAGAAGAGYGLSKYANGYGKKAGNKVKEMKEAIKNAKFETNLARNKELDAFKKEWKEALKAGASEADLTKKYKGNLEKNLRRIGSKHDSTKTVRDLEKKIGRTEAKAKIAKQWKALPGWAKAGVITAGALSAGAAAGQAGRVIGGAANRRHND